jgi:aldehyde dehydrogenase
MLEMAKTIETINPTTGKVIASYDSMDTNEIIQKVKNSRLALEQWKKLDNSERALYMHSLAKIMRKNKEVYAKLITEETGKPIKQSIAEIEKSEWVSNYYAERAESFLSDELIPTEFRKSFVSFEPLGVVVAIMPWNFPFWQVIRFAVPTLTVGNVGILKHSSKCPGSALKIEEAFKDAGFPENVFQVVIGDYKAGELLVQSEIDAVSFNGSLQAGKRIGELASKNLKKFVLILGGSDPFVVLEDADLSYTVDMAIQSRLLNTGQSSISAKRFIVVSEVAEKFSKLFVENIKAEIVGDPMDPKTTVGPLITESHRQVLTRQVDDAKSKGGKILTGGNIINREGYFYEPTVISNVNHQMDILREGVYGPVAPIIVVDNEDEAIREANNSEFGLGASIWTNNIERGIHLARQIQSGMVSVNEIVKTDPRMPFGGIKHSGTGRELYKYGIREFVNIKSIVIKDIESKLLVE